MPRLTPTQTRHLATTFQTAHGWMALVWSKDQLTWATLGQESALSAQLYLESKEAFPEVEWDSPNDRWIEQLVGRIQDAATGTDDLFLDIDVDHSGRTDFQIKIYEACRRIAWGSTISYGELAGLAGRPKAARSVGTAMRKNRIPLLIPCHRVVSSNGLGGYSAPDGLGLKKRLLAIESASASVS